MLGKRIRRPRRIRRYILDWRAIARTAEPALLVRIMKMKKSLVALCLTAGLFASVPGVSTASDYIAQNTSAAPAIPAAALQQLTRTPVDQSKRSLPNWRRRVASALDVAGITGPVALIAFRRVSAS